MKRILLLILTLLILIPAFCQNPGISIYVSPDGLPENPGTHSQPASFEAAIRQTRDFLLKNEKLPPGGIEILLLEGRYPFQQAITLGPEFQGTANNPIAIKAAPGERVVFDGAYPISSDGFEVPSSGDRSRLAASARDHILVKTIKEEKLIEKLSSAVILPLAWGNEVYLPACFPNDGFITFVDSCEKKEVYPPAMPVFVIAQYAGRPPYQEAGKPLGWRGSLDEPRGATVGLDIGDNEMAGSWKQWEKALKKDNSRPEIRGFIDADYHLSSYHMVSANPREKTIHLSKVTRFGWDHVKEKEFRVFGLLCELDQPGEWYFDPQSNKLYVYPPEGLENNLSIGLPYASGFIHLENTSHIHISGVEVSNVGEGEIFRIEAGHHNLIAGCRITNSTANGISISGNHNGILSCDLTDLNSHLILEGGIRSPSQLESGHNFARNCHFYQKNFYQEKIGILLKGVGQVFSHNLIHNSFGQTMRIYGNDHLLELNEFFNVGYEEGDGGAVYSGGDMAGYGNIYRHNFFHHLMHVPGKVARAAIHLDDHQAGAICIGNVFFKSAEKAIFSNHGSGHVIKQNVFLEGALGAYIDAHATRRIYKHQMEILRNPGHPDTEMKANYLGRLEKDVGVEGWKRDPWLTRYPRFNLVMSDTGEFGNMWTIRNVVEDNYYYGHVRPDGQPESFGLLHGCFGDTTVLSRCDPEARIKNIIRNDIQVDPDWFRDYAHMDFSFAGTDPSLPDIPFDQIGLYQDAYRKTTPDKGIYRNDIRNFFEGIPSFPGTKKHFDSATSVEKSHQTP